MKLIGPSINLFIAKTMPAMNVFNKQTIVKIIWLTVVPSVFAVLYGNLLKLLHLSTSLIPRYLFLPNNTLLGLYLGMKFLTVYILFQCKSVKLASFVVSSKE